MFNLSTSQGLKTELCRSTHQDSRLQRNLDFAVWRIFCWHFCKFSTCKIKLTKFWKIGQNAQVEEIVMIFTCLVQYSSGAGLPCTAVQLSTADWPAFTSTFGEVTDTTGATAINVLFVLECKKLITLIKIFIMIIIIMAMIMTIIMIIIIKIIIMSIITVIIMMM